MYIDFTLNSTFTVLIGWQILQYTILHSILINLFCSSSTIYCNWFVSCLIYDTWAAIRLVSFRLFLSEITNGATRCQGAVSSSLKIRNNEKLLGMSRRIEITFVETVKIRCEPKYIINSNHKWIFHGLQSFYLRWFWCCCLNRCLI